MKLKYLLILCPALLFSGCAKLSPQLSKIESTAELQNGVIIFSGYSFNVYRVNINGANYLCNSQGGIIRE